MPFYGRGKNKVQEVLSLKDSYSFYVTNVAPNTKLTSPEYHSIIREFYESISDYILYKKGTFKLPHRLGRVRVCKDKVKMLGLSKLTVDWEQSIKHHVTVHHLNEHTNGYKYYFLWDRTGCNSRNLSYYRLVMTRKNKRLLAKLIKNNKMDYYGK